MTFIRKKEVDFILGKAKLGESTSVVGVSGVGKSELIKQLMNPAVHGSYGLESFLFLKIDGNAVIDYSDRTFYSLILDQIDGQIKENSYSNLREKIEEYHRELLVARDDSLRVTRAFKRAISEVLGEFEGIIFFLDHFSFIYQWADEQLFANLRALVEAHQYRISFHTFTRNMLPNLLEMDRFREEFYELTASSIIGLKPYTKRDAILMLDQEARRIEFNITNKSKNRLYELVGGHAGLLRAALFAVRDNKGINFQDNTYTEKDLVMTHGIEMECEKIWRGLSLSEQKVLLSISHNIDASSDISVERQLQIKGLLTEEEPITIFSPLFSYFITTQDALWEQPLYFDEASRQVWVFGNPAPRLTQLEYRLFQQLYNQAGEVVDKDELIAAGWPNAQGGVSDEALIAAIARLRRKIEPNPKSPRFLENVHNQGFMLEIG